MKNKLYLRITSIIMLIMCLVFVTQLIMADTQTSQRIYDFAGLLTAAEIEELEILSSEYSQKRQVDIIVLTTADTEGKDVVAYMQDFYDEQGLGYDRPHGNTAILTIDMQHREVYVAGFYKGKEYLDDSRCDLIREKITPDLSRGNYYEAFDSFIRLSYRYMGVKPGRNPENIFLKLWFQIAVSLMMAGGIVAGMAYHSGGKVTTGGGTYLDENTSGVTNRRDTYIRTTTTKRKKPSSNNNSSGGSIGGGISRGGHSHSGSRGRF